MRKFLQTTLYWYQVKEYLQSALQKHDTSTIFFGAELHCPDFHALSGQN